MIEIAGVAYAEAADSITPANLAAGRLPFQPDAFIGYPDGRWPDYQQIAADHPGVPVYGLTVLGDGQLGQGDDSEPGNTDIAGAVRDTIAELARGVDRPIKYCPQSWAQAMVAAHSEAGIQRDRYRLLTAHYGGPTMPGAPIPGMHICGAICGCSVEADGTQWQNLAGYDRSLLRPGFITAAPHPGPQTTATAPAAPAAPPPAVPKGHAMKAVIHTPTQQFILLDDESVVPIHEAATGSVLTDPNGPFKLPYQGPIDDATMAGFRRANA